MFSFNANAFEKKIVKKTDALKKDLTNFQDEFLGQHFAGIEIRKSLIKSQCENR